MMTNVQLYLSIGIPCLLVLVNIAVTVAANSRMEARFDAMRSDMRGDMRTLANIGYDHHGRLSKLESKERS